MEEIFQDIQKAIELEMVTKESVKDETKKIDLILRTIQGTLAQIHLDHRNCSYFLQSSLVNH